MDAGGTESLTLLAGIMILAGLLGVVVPVLPALPLVWGGVLVASAAVVAATGLAGAGTGSASAARSSSPSSSARPAVGTEPRHLA
ncbi:MAG TPA: hypothetical protein VE781_07930, partial [Kineosporiaceae bacterium]|nr:hypothetical protein [Kineosporiaceae bacterium]